MNNVKVFPLRLSAEFHLELTKIAKQANKSLHQYVVDLLEKQVKEHGNN